MPRYNSGLVLTHVTSSIPYCTQIVATKLSVAFRRNPLQFVALRRHEAPPMHHAFAALLLCCPILPPAAWKIRNVIWAICC